MDELDSPRLYPASVADRQQHIRILLSVNMPEPVTPGQTPPSASDTPPITPPSGDPSSAELQKAREQIENLNKALQAERSEKEARTKKEAEEAGKFKELYESTNTSHEALKASHESVTKTLEAYDAHFAQEVERALKDLPKEKKALLDKLLDGKSAFEKATIVPDLLKEFGGAGFGQNPPGGQPPPASDRSKELLSK